jgi:hypothetical protein
VELSSIMTTASGKDGIIGRLFKTQNSVAEGTPDQRCAHGKT